MLKTAISLESTMSVILGPEPLHGELVALGTILMSYIQGRNYREVQALVKKLGLPTSLSEIGITKEQTVTAMVNSKEIALKKGRFTPLL